MLTHLQKKRSILWLFLVFIFTFTLYQNNLTAQAAADTKVHFINVTNSTYKSGDATLIEYNGKYMLIDGGREATFNQLDKYLKAKCKKTNGKIVLDAVVITHNHIDHFGGIKKVIKSPDYQVNSIYYNKIGTITPDLKKCIDKVPNKKMVSTGSIISLENWKKGPSIYIYGPITDFTAGKEKIREDDVNNSSLIVRVTAPKLNALILGDLKNPGLQTFKTKYKAALDKTASSRSVKDNLYLNLFKNKYDVCKVGHHGIRAGKQGYTTDEMVIYNNMINADFYIVTTCDNNSQIDAFQSKLHSPCFDFYKYHDSSAFRFEQRGCLMLNGDFGICIRK